MNTIKKLSAATIEIKKSKFHSFLVPYEEFDAKLKELKSLHPKARHFVTAYRYLNEFNQIVEASSDDGEPKGTSGKPTLKVLQGYDLVNVGVITIRYFGGTLLGTGGLVRAYSQAVSEAVLKNELIPFEKLIEDSISVDYELTSKLEYLLKKHNIKVIDRSFLDGITYKILGKQKDIDLVKSHL